MSCEACEDVREKDGIAPDCETEKGCLIPPLGPEERRILEIRGKLITLQGLVDAGTIFQIYGVIKDDIDILTVVEEEMKKQNDGCNEIQRRKCKFEFGEWLEWACKNCEKKSSMGHGAGRKGLTLGSPPLALS